MNDIDQLIRAGRLEAARGLLRRRAAGRDRVGTAALARRAGLPNLALRLLNPIVRPSRRATTATELERAEYAASLTAIGAADEALEILRALDAAANPEVLLFTAFALISRWDYAATIPLLERYVGARALPEYARLVGRVNLAAALVYERREAEAGGMLEALLCATAPYARLHGNVLELFAQIAIRARHWKIARARATEALTVAGGLEALFARKWICVADFLEGPDAQSRRALACVRAEARKLGHWETVRDCDLVFAEADHDEKLLLHLYFGTPFASFRRRMTKITPPSEYRWRLMRGPRPVTRRFDDDGIVGALLRVLSADFYRPPRLAAIHAALYPGEYFNPVSSPARVHQVMKRARRTLAELPLEIAETSSRYYLRATAPCTIVVPGTPPPTRDDRALEKLRAEFGDRAFGAKEAARALEIPRRTASRVLVAAEDGQKLTRSGRGSSTLFRFSAPLPTLSV